MKTYFARNLKFRLIASIGLVAALGTMIMALVAYGQVRFYQNQLWENILLTSIANSRQSIEDWVRDQRQMLEQTALQPAIRQQAYTLATADPDLPRWQMAADTLRTRLTLIQDNAPQLLEIALLSSHDGQILISTTVKNENRPFPFPAVYSNGRQGTYISGILRDLRGQPQLIIATPVYHISGQRVGILIFRLSLNQLTERFHDELLTISDGYIFLTDRNRLPLGGRHPLYTVGVNYALRQKNGVSQYLNADGDKVLGAYNYLPSLQAALVAEVPYSTLMQQANRTGLVLVVSGLALLGLLLALGAIGGQLLLAPIETLVNGMESVANGDLQVRLPVTNQEDELGILAQRFNQMVAELESLYHALEDQQKSYVMLFDEAPDGIVILSADQKIHNANRGWFTLLQTTEVSQVFQQPITRFFHISDQSWELLHKQGTLRLRGHLHRLGGDKLPVDVRCKIISSGLIQMIFTDISDQYNLEKLMRQQQIQLERQVQQRTAELQMANQELEAFTYSVSHDLRAPLRAINGYLNIFLETYGNRLDDQGKSLLEKVQASARRLTDLIRHLLTISRLGRTAMRILPISAEDLQTMIEGIIQEAQLENPAYQKAEIQVQTLLPCRADPALLRQVFQNLIGNALKFSSNIPAPRVEIGSFSGLDGPGYYVHDNGVGFDPAYADKLFAPFQRLHGEAFPGHGAGLAIVHRIVRRHGGRIWAESQPGQGATFYFTIAEGAET